MKKTFLSIIFLTLSSFFFTSCGVKTSPRAETETKSELKNIALPKAFYRGDTLVFSWIIPDIEIVDHFEIELADNRKCSVCGVELEEIHISKEGKILVISPDSLQKNVAVYTKNERILIEFKNLNSRKRYQIRYEDIEGKFSEKSIFPIIRKPYPIESPQAQIQYLNIDGIQTAKITWTQKNEYFSQRTTNGIQTTDKNFFKTNIYSHNEVWPFNSSDVKNNYFVIEKNKAPFSVRFVDRFGNESEASYLKINNENILKNRNEE